VFEEPSITILTQTRDILAAKLPCYDITFGENLKFIGRSTILKTIEKALLGQRLPSEKKHRAFAISGRGGFGKTQTALHFAYQHKHKKNFRSILWASAESRHKLLQSFAAYALLLGIIPKPVESKPTDIGEDAQELIKWYERTGVYSLLECASGQH
jgi:hypothetical protein